MELIDTPNPNAKKIITDLSENEIPKTLAEVDGINSIFFGPGFITITKNENKDWELINQDIINILDKL